LFDIAALGAVLRLLGGDHACLLVKSGEDLLQLRHSAA
jgi:hypothetical protein